MLHIYKSIYCHAGRWIQLRCSEGKLKKYADFQDMVVVREFSDEGKSGKNVDGRPQFKEMLELIEAGTDDIDYVLVFKLSRFGRNAADVLSSLQKMQDFGVNQNGRRLRIREKLRE